MSPHGEALFDLILHLGREYGHDWKKLKTGVELSSPESSSLFLDFAAMFLDNLGNFRVSMNAITEL